MNASLNDIILNSMMLENLYGRSLVETGGSGWAAPPVLKFLGNNARHVTILVRNLQHTFLPDDQLSFLTRMLQACQLNTGDVAIVNMAEGVTIKEVLGQLSPEKIISFGVNTPGSGALQGISFLGAPDLEELVQENRKAKIAKGELWASLKKLFGIS